MDKENITWSAPEYDYEHRRAEWYLLSIVIAVGLIVLSLWQRNFLFALFILLAEMAILLSAKQFPPVWDFEVNAKGVRIGDKKFFNYAEMEGFDVHYDTDEYNHLVVRINHRFSPDLTLRMPAHRSDEIEKFIAKNIPRQSYDMHLIDAVAKLLKF